MLVLAVKGSPRVDGKTNKFIDTFLKGVAEAGHDVKIYNVGIMALKGCQSCYACKEQITDCVIDDELKNYFADLHNADALIIGAPNYASGVCGQMVSFMNRHYCLIDKEHKPHIKPGIKVVGVFAQGQQDKEKYIDNYRWFMSDFERRNMELIDIVVATSATEDEELFAKANEIAKSL